MKAILKDAYSTVPVVLFKIDWTFEWFYRYFSSVREIYSVIDAGSHAFAYLLYCLERVVKTQLNYVLASKNFAEYL